RRRGGVGEPLLRPGARASDRFGAPPARGRERTAPRARRHDDLARRYRGLREGPRPGRDARDAGRAVPALGGEPDDGRGGRAPRPDLGAPPQGAVRAWMGRDGGRRARLGGCEGPPSRRDPVPRGRSDVAPRAPVRRLEGGAGAWPALHADRDDPATHARMVRGTGPCPARARAAGAHVGWPGSPQSNERKTARTGRIAPWRSVPTATSHWSSSGSPRRRPSPPADGWAGATRSLPIRPRSTRCA